MEGIAGASFVSDLDNSVSHDDAPMAAPRFWPHIGPIAKADSKMRGSTTEPK